MEEKKSPWFPKQIWVEVTEKAVRAFIGESEESLEAFLDWMFQSHEYTMSEYIEDAKENFADFILSGGAAE